MQMAETENVAKSAQYSNASFKNEPKECYQQEQSRDATPVNESECSEMPFRRKIATKLRIRNELVREFMAECLGTFILMVFGNGAVAQTVLSGGSDGDYLTIYWAYGMGVTMAVYIAGGVSGAHINPAVSLAMSVIGRLPLVKLPWFVLAQLLGAFLSGPVVYGIYYDALEAYDGGVRQVLGPNGTASIFATYPKNGLSIINGLFDQIFATALLLCGILAINDRRNNKPPSGLEPFLVGLLVFTIGNSYATNCGYAINPARDFGPRLFTYMAGWGSEVFTEPDGKNWAWVPVVGPLIGGTLGALVYLLVIEIHWPPEHEVSEHEHAKGRGRCADEVTEVNQDESSLIVRRDVHEDVKVKSAAL